MRRDLFWQAFRGSYTTNLACGANRRRAARKPMRSLGLALQYAPKRAILSSVGLLFQREYTYAFTRCSLRTPEPAPLSEGTQGFAAHSFDFHPAREQGQLPPRRRIHPARADPHRLRACAPYRNREPSAGLRRLAARRRQIDRAFLRPL